MAKESPVSLKNLTVLGKEHLPSGGGFMILPSRLDHLDLMRLEALLGGRPVVYLLEQGAALDEELKAHLEKESVHAMAIVPHATDPGTYRTAVHGALKDGSVIIYLPAQAAAITAPFPTVPGTKLEFLLKADVR